MRIRIEFQGPGFVAVPNHVVAMVGQTLRALGVTAERLETLRLSPSLLDERFAPADLAALVVMAALPVGSDWAATWFQTRMGVGREAWQATSRRLRALGSIFDDFKTTDDGRHHGRSLCVRWPDAPAVAKSKPRRPSGDGAGGWKHRKPGKPNAGKPVTGVTGKPNAGKPGIRSGEVIENEGETVCEGVENPSCTKTHTPGCTAAPLTGLAAAQPGGAPSDNDGRRPAGSVAVDPARVAALSRFERSRLRSGDTVMVDGVMIEAGSPLHAQWQEAVRAHDAQNVVRDDTSRPSPDRVAR